MKQIERLFCNYVLYMTTSMGISQGSYNCNIVGIAVELIVVVA